MGVVTVAAAVSAVSGAEATVAVAWLRTHSQLRRARERSRHGHLRDLPPGSRVVDLGRHGLVIEIGPRPVGDGSHLRAAR